MNVMELFRLDGRVALVTGGSGLYGTHICRALGEAGATVVTASRNLDKGEAFAAALRGEGLRAAARPLDLSDEGSVIALVQSVAADFGTIDILVNNAVSREGIADLEKLSVEGWEKAQKVNATGTMLMTRETVKVMRAAGRGSIINIASIRGVDCPHFPVYGDTGMSSGLNYSYDKWGLIGLSKWVAGYYGKYGIRCNAISPGGYNPALETQEDNEFIKNYRKMTPLGRLAGDDDIKGAVVYLASDASAYVTGHNLLVDGGWTIW